MTSRARRIAQLEKRLLPQPLTAADREFLARLEAGRRRVREYRQAHGIPEPSHEGLPPKKVFTSRGVQLTMDILNEGRDRARLRSLRDQKLRESIPLAEGRA